MLKTAQHKTKYTKWGPNGPMGCIAQSGYFLCQDVYISDSDYSGMDPFQGLCLCKLQGKTQSNTKMHDSHRDHKVCRWNHSQVEPAVILFLGLSVPGWQSSAFPSRHLALYPHVLMQQTDDIYFAGHYIICTTCELWDKRTCWVSFKGMYHTQAE